MKPLRILIAGLAAAGVGVVAWQIAERVGARPDGRALVTGPFSGPPTNTVTDPVAVFQKAFWKRPSAADEILHAERREWHDADGVSRWQWFIGVKPSAALVEHLITANAFMLAPASAGKGAAPRPPAGAPDWFPAEAPETFANAAGSFLVLWDKERNILHATDGGTGFRPGAPEPAKPVPAAPSEGRLPATPPPRDGVLSAPEPD